MKTGRKGQAAIEYLMNYAWAIALIIIVGIAIFALDIGGLRTSIQSRGDVALQTGDTITVEDWAYTVDGLTEGGSGNTVYDNVTVTIQNNGQNDLTVDLVNVSRVNDIDVTTSDSNGYHNGCTGVKLYQGQVMTACSIALNKTGTNTDPGVSVGEQTDVQLNITYTDDESGIQREIIKELTTEAE